MDGSPRSTSVPEDIGVPEVSVRCEEDLRMRLFLLTDLLHLTFP